LAGASNNIYMGRVANFVKKRLWFIEGGEKMNYENHYKKHYGNHYEIHYKKVPLPAQSRRNHYAAGVKGLKD